MKAPLPLFWAMSEPAGVLPIEDLEPADTVLISGPPFTGKYPLLLRLITRYADSAIVITTKHGASRVREDFAAIPDAPPADHIGVIDCVTDPQSPTAPDDDVTMYAPSPSNLTGIGVRFTELSSMFNDREVGHVGVGFHSLSQLVMHADIRKVYQFVQVLTGQIRGLDWFGAAVVDESIADEQHLTMLQHHFDGVIQTRETEDGRRELRVRGLSPQATDWQPY